MNSTLPQLHFQTSGPRTALPIVFLHGGGAGSWMWEKVMALLPQYYCLAPDLPEQGQSRDAGPFSVETAARITADLIQFHLPGRKAAVVGLSEGAQVAVAMLSQFPEIIEKAMISSALLRPLPGMSLLTPALLAWSYRSTMAPFRNSDFWIRLNMKYSAGIPDEYYPAFKKEFQGMTESGFVHLMDSSLHFILPEGLNKAEIPALVIAGKKEYSAMKKSALDLSSALPRAQAYLLDLGPKSSLAKEHNWAMTVPDLFARTVHAWITGKPLPPQLSPLSRM